MKSLILAAGFFGAVGLITAAPASADTEPDTTVSCAPAYLCRIGTVPERAAADLASFPDNVRESFEDLGNAPGRVASTIPRAQQSLATTIPRALLSIATTPQRALDSIASTPQRAQESLGRPFGSISSTPDSTPDSTPAE